ncbi:hypothetical protein P167DRAFT_575266 [Morchella conica CCBAS932]|uniref:Uncharacterized protein n=1 Tax=Morchella conica CCBAS932 TaxID=1392247 RepID=A0A3N4KLT3_9PEZI|nr:hypothetical protein P167DRAFT_575266 [Morchella conica CCBAS932]
MWAKIFFFGVNPFVVWWHVLYVERTVNPFYNPRYVLNNSAMQGHFAGLVILGAFLTPINAIVLWPFLRSFHDCKHLIKVWFFWMIYCLLVLLYIFASLIQFVSPFISGRIAWRAGYNNVCKGHDTRVYLDVNPGEPARMLRFGDIKGGDGFEMMMEPDPYTIWGFDNRGTYNFTIIGQSSQPWERINYDLANSTYTVYLGNTTVNTGQFHTGRHFAMPDLKLTGDTLAFAEACVFDPTLKIYEDKEVFMRSVQFGLCSKLQLCAASEIEVEGMKVAVPTGLFVLMRAGRRKTGCCKGEITPGIDARGG